MEEFERMRNEATSKLDQEKQKLRDSEVEVREKIREDLVQQKRKLVRERKHYDEERKQLARLSSGWERRSPPTDREPGRGRPGR